MVRQKYEIPNLAWIFTSFGFMCFLIGSGWSISQAKIYELELAQYKLAVGSVLVDVATVTNTLDDAANTSAISPAQKQKIERLTNKSEAVIEQARTDIDEETNKLINFESEQ
ncbi:MAG: hypothetical protein RLZZ574_1527 [Cyanobacteriota bacterium]|jgi:hypothetical protein